MPPQILAIVLLAAACHATWNLLAKQSRGGTGFVWLGSLAGTVAYAPVAVVALVLAPGRLDEVTVLAMFVSGVLHSVYFVALQRGYRDGDLSFVYPVSRGVGPLVAIVVGIAVLGERPGVLALAGGAIIVASVLSLAASPGGTASRSTASFAVLAGTAIGLYTVWDKHAVDALALSPVIYYWGSNAANLALLSPWAARHPDAVREAWIHSRMRALGVGLLSPLAYILILVALTRAPVTVVAPARETSIVVATLLGATVLAEGDRRRRVAAAVGVVAGIAALSLG